MGFIPTTAIDQDAVGRELAYLQRLFPDPEFSHRLKLVITALEREQVDAMDCATCFYGHFMGGNERLAEHMIFQVRLFLQNNDWYTPIEEFLVTRSILGKLRDASERRASTTLQELLSTYLVGRPAGGGGSA